jgi:hypothetical protein
MRVFLVSTRFADKPQPNPDRRMVRPVPGRKPGWGGLGWAKYMYSGLTGLITSLLHTSILLLAQSCMFSSQLAFLLQQI